ncbi:MAG: DUF493 domain-containing protein [Spirochaetaceae bacterium]|nr:DUF493 domain-containing protein [Spirochaetaceae bacterium]
METENPASGKDSPVCKGPFGDAAIEYPIGFDLRIIYTLAEAPAMSELLGSTLKRLDISFTLIQGLSVPGKKYARMGARITVSSKESMDALYREVSRLPGVKAVI